VAPSGMVRFVMIATLLFLASFRAVDRPASPLPIIVTSKLNTSIFVSRVVRTFFRTKFVEKGA